MSKKESLCRRHEEVDMGRLLERAYSNFAEEARRRGIDYRQEIGARPVIIADGDRVLQIIFNLLSNAFRWTPDGGSVELALDQENGTISVAVEDSGPGIPEDEVDRIFRPFWSRDGGGTGFGVGNGLKAGVVGATMRHRVAHATGDGPIVSRSRSVVEDSGDGAHQVRLIIGHRAAAPRS